MGLNGFYPNPSGKKDRWKTSEDQQCKTLFPNLNIQGFAFSSEILLVNIHKSIFLAQLLLFPFNGKTITCLIQKTTFKVLHWETFC